MKLNLNELNQIKTEIKNNQINDFEIVKTIVIWAQIWKYLKINIISFKEKKELTCGLQKILINNIFDSVIIDLSNNQSITIQLLFSNYIRDLCASL